MENEVKVEKTENVEKKKSKGLLVIVLVLIIFALAGVIAYLLFFGKDLLIATNNVTSGDGNTSVIVKNKSKADSVKVMSPDERYAEYLKGLEKNIKARYNSQDSDKIDYNVIKGRTDYYDSYFTFEWRINEKLELVLNSESYDVKATGDVRSSSQKDVKIAENVVSMFIAEQAQADGFYTLYYIKTDGSVNKVSIANVPNKEYKHVWFDIFNIEKYDVKNIVDVLPVNYKLQENYVVHGAVLVDIEGNLITDGSLNKVKTFKWSEELSEN